ncbi:MAG: universal stress protein [Bacteroidota bacterium]
MLTIQHILVPVDFSDCSKNALKQAIKIGDSMKAEIHILHAYHVPVPASPMTMSIENDQVDNYKKETEVKFEVLRRELPELNNREVNFIFDMAFAIDSIKTTVSQNNIDLIVMGTQGSGTFGNKLLGSTTYNTIDRVDCPVLAIPEDTTSLNFEKILLATDYKHLKDTKQFDMLKALSNDNSEVQLLHVSKEPSKLSIDKSTEAINLDNYFGDLNHSFHFMQDTDVEGGIQKYVEENDIDVLSIIPHEHNFFGRLFKESITRKVIQNIQIPTLALRKA